LYRIACANEIEPIDGPVSGHVGHSAAGAVGNLPVLARSIDGVATWSFPVTPPRNVLTDFDGSLPVRP
jgi:hypothetical protein